MDLFGNPVPAHFGMRGRPPYEPNQKDANKIKLLLALGWSNERVARAIGITQPTLRKYYFSLLKCRDYQRDMMEAERMTRLYEMGMAGNVGAIKEFDRLLERNDAMVAQADVTSRPKADREERVKSDIRRMGKKEQAQQDAEQVSLGGGEWGADLSFRGRSVN
jgi:hypothetical protein